MFDFGLKTFISLYKLQAETYNTHYNNNTEHLHNRDSEESQIDFCNPSLRKKCVIFKPMNNVNTITLYNLDIQVEIKYFNNVEIR